MGYQWETDVCLSTGDVRAGLQSCLEAEIENIGQFVNGERQTRNMSGTQKRSRYLTVDW